MVDQTNKFKGDGTDEIRRSVIKYYRHHVYGAFSDNMLEWNSKNKMLIVDIIKKEFQDCNIRTIETILDEYFKEF